MSQHPRELLSAYLDGELSPDAQAALQAHLAGCAQCTDELEELALVDRAARALDEPAPEGYFEELPGRVRQRLRAARQAAAARAPRRLPTWSWAVAATVLLGLLLPVLWQRRVELPLPATIPAPVEAPATGPQSRRDTEVGEEQPGTSRASSTAEAKAETSGPKMQGPYEAEAKSAPARQGGPRQGAPAAVPPVPAATAVPAMAEEVQPQERGATGFAVAPPAAPAPAPASAPMASESDRDRLGALGYADGRPAPAAGSGQPAAAEPARPPAAKRTETEQGLRKDEAPPERLRSRSAANEDRRKAELGRSAGAAQPAPGKQKGDVDAFAELQARRPASAHEARALAREWQRAAERQRDATLADEARLRALEALAAALRLSGSAADRTALEQAVAAYAARADAAQKPRARALLE